MVSFIEEEDLEYRKITLEDQILPISIPSGRSDSSASSTTPQRRIQKMTKLATVGDETDDDIEVSFEKNFFKVQYLENSVLSAAIKEEGILQEQQPLYVDYEGGKLKCSWCKEQFCGSTTLKQVNQHLRKSATHQKKRKDFLQTCGGQRDLRQFLSPNITFDLQ